MGTTARNMMTGMLFPLLLAACGQGQQAAREQVPVTEDTTFLTGTFFLVRHAEKNPGADSTLTAAGLQRAGKLYRLLKDSAISKIYSTRYRRTMQTGDSLRIRNSIDTVLYQPDSTGESLLYEISRRGDWGRRILIIGHSNTLLPILKSLNVDPRMDAIADTDYGNLFIVYKSTKGSRLVKQRY
ncbi:phosphoglycerate mutase [Chitinophaga alhagiae]|uniref:Phosphoglycerate mutase n=1 Tax=Chitinophaga alhagiae TaxID=2203219 RepID=A0ABM6W979_9BACT|nr:histidine phosphatase family protein [Chitinophaga alhagiae]AWO00419.1 phosphoglycerate mutase [Chitinophaga alhagiae]